jgi:uncharacterized protein with von Willebrand factor type A (vWA) domain
VTTDPLVANLLRFGDVLRRGGLDVHPGRMRDAVTALELVGVTRRQDVRAALRCLLVHRRDDIAFFDEAFDRFWKARRQGGESRPLFSLGERPRVVAVPARDTRVEFDAAEAAAASATPPRLAASAWSGLEALRTRDFSDLSAEELRRAEMLLADLGWRLGVRRTRRWTPARSGAVDLRRIVRRNVKHGGELIDLTRRARREKPRPLLVLGDVSGSMERYTRMLLQFLCGVSGGPQAVESFVFATRLTRVTRQVAERGASHALDAVSHRVQDWGGGTRIGESLRAFNVHWARRVMRHAPVAIIVSDGWDRGDPELLARELARVRRSCSRLVWLNPLLGSSTYEPLTRGMLAALPLIDDFLPAHNLASFEQLAERLRELPLARRARTEVRAYERQRVVRRPEL